MAKELRTLKGVVHVHTTLSHDGKETLAALKELFKGHGYNFVCLNDHSQDVTPEQFADLTARCLEYADEDFVFIPGLEYSCDGEIHIMGIGIKEKAAETAPGVVIDRIRSHGGISVLSHPTKSSSYVFEDDWVKKLDGAELWNRGVDSRLFPERVTIRQFADFRAINPGIYAFFGQDLHRRRTYIDLAVKLQAERCSKELIVEALRRGEFSCWSPLFAMPAKADVPPFTRWYMGMIKSLFNAARFVKGKLP